jgi:hypothetical protein
MSTTTLVITGFNSPSSSFPGQSNINNITVDNKCYVFSSSGSADRVSLVNSNATTIAWTSGCN